MDSEATRRTELIKAEAESVGFDLVGVAPSDAPTELRYLAEWVARGHAAEMAYLSSQVERRSALTAAFPWARSVVCVGLQYDTPQPYSIAAAAANDRGWIARYAWGDDYHDVMKKRLVSLERRLGELLGDFQCRSYVDTGPIVERAYAAAAGLGAWGKNTCLLHPVHGSWFFLGELVTDLELTPDEPLRGMCGSCTACLDACPTGALPEPYVLDSNRCISYLTIEHRGAIPDSLREGMGHQVFGCDICQDVCPWNRKRRTRGPEAFEAREGLVAPDLTELARLDGPAFRQLFRKSPVTRAKHHGLLRNVVTALGNQRPPGARAALEPLADDEDPAVREHARWALAKTRLGSPPLPGCD